MGAVAHLGHGAAGKKAPPATLFDSANLSEDSTACQFGAGCIQRPWQRRARQVTFHSSALDIDDDFRHE